MILFQHAGGEQADWEDSKVEKEGTHPVVYPAAGSHATFYDSTVYVQNGPNGSGVGCDNTSEPLREVRPRPDRGPDLPDHHRPLQVAHLLRPLGAEGEGLQQRADRADDEDAVARTVHLDGKAALDQPAAAGRLVRRARRHRRLLRRGRHRLRRDQPRVALATGGDRDDRGPRPAADPLRRRDPLGPGRPDRAAPAPRLRPARAGRPPALRPPLADVGADRAERAGDRRRGARPRRPDRRPARRRQRHRSLRRPPGARRHDRIARAADRRGDRRRGGDLRRAPAGRDRRDGLPRLLARHAAALLARRRRLAAAVRRARPALASP